MLSISIVYDNTWIIKCGLSIYSYMINAAIVKFMCPYDQRRYKTLSSVYTNAVEII